MCSVTIWDHSPLMGSYIELLGSTQPVHVVIILSRGTTNLLDHTVSVIWRGWGALAGALHHSKVALLGAVHGLELRIISALVL